MVRSTTDAQDAQLGANQTTRLRVDIEDSNGTLKDYRNFKGYNWIRSAKITNSVDAKGIKADVSIWMKRFNWNLSPLDVSADGFGSSSPIKIGRKIKIYCSTDPRGTGATSLTWQLLFEGEIDDWNIKGSKNPVLQLKCLDKFTRLLDDRFVEQETIYSEQQVESLIQQILDDWAGSSAPTLYNPSNPAWKVRKYKQTKMSVFEAIKQIVDQFGWYCKTRWDSGTSKFRFTLVEPDRDVSPGNNDYTFSPSEYYDIAKAKLSRKKVRNVVYVRYGDTNDRDDDDLPERKKVEAKDQNSIDKYGRQWMEIAEPASTEIDEESEAQRMADNILKDLKEPELDHAVSMPLFWPVQLGDYYKFRANGVHYSGDQELAVISYKHVFSHKGQAKTTIQTRGKPVSGIESWISIGVRTGQVLGAREEGPVDTSQITQILENPYSAEIEAPKPDDPRWMDTEVHVSKNKGFTPDSSTYYKTTRADRISIEDLDYNEDYYVKLKLRDRQGNKSDVSQEKSVKVEGVDYGDIHYSLKGAAKLSNKEAGSKQSVDTSPSKTIDSKRILFDNSVVSDPGLYCDPNGGVIGVDNTGMYQINASVQFDNVSDFFDGGTGFLKLSVANLRRTFARNNESSEALPPFEVYATTIMDGVNNQKPVLQVSAMVKIEGTAWIGSWITYTNPTGNTTDINNKDTTRSVYKVFDNF